VFAPPREDDTNQITLWVVPKGQPLPDLNESEEEPETRP